MFMTTYFQHQLEGLLRGLHIDPDRRQISFGQEPTVVDYPPDALRPTLAGLLYQHFYHAPADVPPTPEFVAADASFEDQLSRHNHSAEHFDASWLVEAVDQAGAVYATKGSQRRMLFAGEYLYETFKRGPAQEGDALRLLARAEHRDAQSGFYYLFGQTLGDDSTALQTRTYFHLTPDGAAPLIAWLTQTLNAYHVPFQFKCLNRPERYTRSDAGVLYLQKPLVSFVLHRLADNLDQLAPYLRPAVPLFTRRLAPGLGFAESPSNPNESFGTSRCGLLAQGIAHAVDAHLPPSQYSTKIQEVFQQVGLSLDHPYLNPRAHYPYHFPAAFA